MKKQPSLTLGLYMVIPYLPLVISDKIFKGENSNKILYNFIKNEFYNPQNKDEQQVVKDFIMEVKATILN